MAWYEELPRPQFSRFPAVETGQSWYTVLRLEPNLFALCEPKHIQEVISFLIVGTRGALLFDTGMGICPIRPVVEELTSLPVTVVNSHSHFDHTGCNAQFPFVWGVERSESVERAAQTWRPLPEDENFQPDAFYPPCPAPADYHQAPYRLRAVSEGQAFSLGDSRWQVLYAPGHSKDGLVLFCEERRLVLAGDTLYPGTLYAMDDPENYAHTLRRLAERFSDYTLLCSHNEPVRPGGLLARAADAMDAMLRGETVPEPQCGGLWLHRTGGVKILSRISG